MIKMAKNLNFMAAAQLRDKIQEIEKIIEEKNKKSEQNARFTIYYK